MAGGRRARRFVGLMAVAVLGLVLGAPTVADAAEPPWRIVWSPNRGLVPGPNGFINNTLLDVSCVNDTRCVAVGYDDHNPDSSGGYQRSVVQTLVAGSWKLRPIRQPGDPANLHNKLLSVSCVTGLRCVAVGSYYDSGLQRTQTLIATYVQDRWSVVASPNRAGLDNLLSGVDCTDATHCVAVGTTRDDIGGGGVQRTLWVPKTRPVL